MTYEGAWVASRITLRNFQRFQIGAVIFLIICGTAHYCFREFLEPTALQRATRIFDVGKEDSVPTAYSILNLFVSSILLYSSYMISKFRCEKVAVYWLFLATIFLFLSIDEAASIHEKTGGLTNYIGLGGIDFPYNRWVFIGAIFAGIVFVLFIPFLLSLPRRTALLILISGGIFVCGALGMETVGGLMLKTGVVGDRTDFLYAMRRVVEEGLEMIGIALFNCTLFAYIAPSIVGIEFNRQSD